MYVSPSSLVEVFVFILGLLFGSFFSALSFRMTRNISISRGRSLCPNCKHKISWYDNIPLFSFLMLWGRCRNCKKKISIRYPIIEAVTAIGFLYIYLSDGSAIHMLYSILIFATLVLIFVIDFEHQIIPDSLIFFGILVTVLKILILDQSIYSGLFAGFLAATLLLLLNIITKGRGMGLGDVKFAVLGGLILGLNYFLIWLFVSFLTGGIYGTILILGRRAGLKDKVAFGPFLIIGLIITQIWGEKILRSLLLN